LTRDSAIDVTRMLSGLHYHPQLAAFSTSLNPGSVSEMAEPLKACTRGQRALPSSMVQPLTPLLCSKDLVYSTAQHIPFPATPFFNACLLSRDRHWSNPKSSIAGAVLCTNSAHTLVSTNCCSHPYAASARSIEEVTSDPHHASALVASMRCHESSIGAMSTLRKMPRRRYGVRMASCCEGARTACTPNRA